MFKKTNQSIQLSTQNLVDCCKTAETDACHGGIMTDAFSWIENNGIMAESEYPYNRFQEGNDNSPCRYNKRLKVASVKGFVELPEGSEKELELAVKNIGPISVGIQASFLSMQFYSTGIYFEPKCDPQSINR
jgi:Papain family cysteine protease